MHASAQSDTWGDLFVYWILRGMYHESKSETTCNAISYFLNTYRAIDHLACSEFSSRS